MFFEHPANAADDEDSGAHRDQFTGVAPLFPLGNVTLLPNVVQPFHMFEPRYRQLAEDAVEGDGFLALGVLQPGHSDQYESKTAPVFPVACLGRIMQYEPLPGGRWNLIVQGLWRGRIREECTDQTPYRRAYFEVFDEQSAEDCADVAVDTYRNELVSLFEASQPQLAAHRAVRDVLEQEMPLGLLADFVAHALDLSPTVGADLLGEPVAMRRVMLLISMLQAHLRERGGDDRPFPPEFSMN